MPDEGEDGTRMNAQQRWAARLSAAASPVPASTDESDDALLRRVSAGDHSAWRALVSRHLSGLVSQAWYVLGDRAEAEDVAQETFVRLMQKARDWEPGGPHLRSWLYRVTLNLCIDRKRSRWRPRPLDDAAEKSDSDDPAGNLARRMDLNRAVAHALGELSERQRNAIVLVHYQGFTNYEAAEIIDTSVDALESLLARARRTLRTAMQDHADDLLGD
jgi:RNA polymerase sigma-70 factor (ECF subfamily)